MSHPQRWYDRDPLLSRAMESLRQAPSRYHAQVALNIIKIIVEHHIEGECQVPSETIEAALYRAQTLDEHQQRRRWYDVNETLRSAILLLEDLPDPLQDEVIPPLALMIESTLAKAA